MNASSDGKISGYVHELIEDIEREGKGSRIDSEESKTTEHSNYRLNFFEKVNLKRIKI